MLFNSLSTIYVREKNSLQTHPLSLAESNYLGSNRLNWTDYVTVPVELNYAY
jgi:hypothetical protein